jgi:hypothetical protein
MPEKTYRPKSGNEGLVVTVNIERRVVGYADSDGKKVSLNNEAGLAQGLTPIFDRAEGEPLEISTWPYTTEVEAEQVALDQIDVLTDQAPPKKTSGASDGGGGS